MANEIKYKNEHVESISANRLNRHDLLYVLNANEKGFKFGLLKDTGRIIFTLNGKAVNTEIYKEAKETFIIVKW